MIDEMKVKLSTILDSRFFLMKKEHPGLGMLLFVSVLLSPGCLNRISLRALIYASSATFSFWVASISMISSTRLW